MAIECNRCEQMCGLVYLPVAGIPKDHTEPIAGTTPQGLMLQDIRPYCRKNYVEPPAE